MTTNVRCLWLHRESQGKAREKQNKGNGCGYSIENQNATGTSLYKSRDCKAHSDRVILVTSGYGYIPLSTTRRNLCQTFDEVSKEKLNYINHF